MLLIPLGIFGLSWQQKVRPKLKPFPVACSCRATFDRYGEDGLKGNVRRHSASDHAFNNSNHFTGFPTGRNIWKQFFKIFRSGTDRYIVSSIKSKFGDRFFVDLHALYKLWIWNCFCFDLQNNFMFTTFTKHVKQDLVFKFWLNWRNYVSFLKIYWTKVQLNKIFMQKCSVVWDLKYIFGWECLR